MSSTFCSHRAHPATLAAVCAVLCVSAGCASDPVERLAEELSSRSGAVPRFSIHQQYQPCPEQIPPGGTLPRPKCARESSRLRWLGKAGARRTDPRALRLRIVADLLAGGEEGNRLDASITSLHEIARRDSSAAAFTDLGAALLLRAGQRQRPRDILAAIDASEAALSRDPRDVAALYNRALGLDRWGLADQAAWAWRRYLAVDSTSLWAADARRRMHALVRRAVPAPPLDAPQHTLRDYADAEPGRARELGMSRLGEWGEALLAGNVRSAEAYLRVAEELGEQLARRGGDCTVADAVQAIGAAGEDARTLRRLAVAHREFNRGMEERDNTEFSEALLHFNRVRKATAGRSPAVWGWATMYAGTSLAQTDQDSAMRMLRSVIIDTGTARYPALQARARWSLGNVLLRAEMAEEAMRQTQASARLFLRAGDRENAAGALTVLKDAYLAMGMPEDGYAAAHLATTHLRSYPGSVRLHTLLAGLSRNAESQGLPASALYLQNEGVAVARRNGRPAHRSEALVARARLLAGRGDLRGASRDLDEALPLIRSRRPGFSRNWLLADVNEADAAVQMKLSNPRGALAAADSATGYWLRIRLPFREIATLRQAAEAALALGDRAAAKERLSAGLHILEERRDSMQMQAGRAAVFDVERGLTDRLVLLELAEGRAARALDVMDRARASLASAGLSRDEGRAALSGPAGEVVAQYARIADTLLVWTVRGRRVDVYRTVVDTLSLARGIKDLESAMERRSGEEALHPALARLHTLLVRPVTARLGEAGTSVVFVADGELATIPFAALYDAGTRRYLMEDHPVRFAVSLREARRPRRDRAPAAALFVADPAFDQTTHSLLGALPRTRAGVRAMAAGYRDAVVMEGSAATERALVAALGRAGVVHFGGHAVFDDARPDSSFLVLAPERGRPGSGELRAARIAELDLRHVRLVVLAACQTQRKEGSRGGGYSGLSGALRAAGAGATLGSTWSVDERLTGALMTEFHRAYRASGDGPRALREAQLALLHSPDPALRTPAAWAGFQYAGR